MNVSEVTVQYLKAAGIGHVFGYPGDPNVELMEAARRAGLQFVLGRREGAMVDNAGALRKLLAGARPKDRPLVVGAHRRGAIHRAVLSS